MFDRKKQLRWASLKVGLVLTAALAVLVVVVIFAGGLEEMFTQRAELRALIRDVKGLRTGAPVWISGIEVGYVKKIKLHPEHGTVVVLAIKKDALSSLHTDSEASIMTMGLLGDKFIDLSPGTPASGPIDPGLFVKGASQIEFTDVVEASAVSLNKMTDVIGKLDILVTKVESGEGTVAKFLTDPAVYNNIRETTRSLNAILQRIERSRGTAQMLIEDPTLYEEMKKAASTIAAASTDLAAFGRKMNSEQGTLHKLAEDPALYDNLNDASRKLSAVVGRVDRGEGLAGTLVRDDQFSQEMKDTVAELKALSAELKELVADIKAHPRKYFKFSLF